MKYADVQWRDGQPYSPGYGDIYYSSAGGREESEYVFLQQNELNSRWRKLGAGEHFVIAETGFGTGLNFVLTMKAWAEKINTGEIDPDACLHYFGIEKHPVSPADIERVAGNWPELSAAYEALLTVYSLPVEGEHCRALLGGRVQLHLMFADVIDALEPRALQVDAWYLDGFGPDKNAELWSDQVFQLIEKNSGQGATLSTYTAAGFVRRGLQAAGFSVSKVKGHGKKREMITAILKHKKIIQSSTPWYELEQNRYQNRKAVIIGAGLAGLSCAWSLVRRGWQVTVIEKHHDVAEEASGNPAGLLMPRLSIDNTTDARFYASAMLYASHCLDELQKQTDEKFWFHDGVYSIFKAGKAEKLIEKQGYAESFMEILHQHDLKNSIADQSATLSFFPAAGWASPRSICENLLRVCGGSLQLIQQNVVDVQQKPHQHKHQWQALDAQGRSIASAEVMIIANGVGANQFESVSWLPLSSVRGQITEIPASKKSASLNRALSFDAYVTPEHKGVHYAGATYRVGDDSPQLTQAEQDETLSHLEQCLPGVFTPPGQLTGRVGFRPVSDDMTPIVGAVPDKNAYAEDYKELHHGRPHAHYPPARYLSGLYVSAAHGSRGICSSFLSAEILAAMIVNEPLPVNRQIVEHLSPARFLMRKLKRGQSLD